MVFVFATEIASGKLSLDNVSDQIGKIGERSVTQLRELTVK